MGCRQCWKKLKRNQRHIRMLYMHSAKTFSKISLYGIDTNTTEGENPTFAEFIFFGQQGNIIIGKEADYLLEEATTRNEGIPREISNLVGKDFIVIVILDDNTLNSDHYMFQVKSIEHATNPELLAPLPLHNGAHPGSTGQSSSSATTAGGNAEHNLLATPPPAELASRESEKVLPEEHEASFTGEAPEGKKRQNIGGPQ